MSARTSLLPETPASVLEPVQAGQSNVSPEGAVRSLSWFFCFFFLSGFCSLLYEIVWLRLAMAQFGVTSALVSIVLSMFMAGLGLGSWASGRLIRRYGDGIKTHALRFYALTELLIGVSALVVPYELRCGRTLLEHTGWSSSGAYYLASGAWVALTLIPWCTLMGATIPIAMLAIRNDLRRESSRSFSFLYLSNVLGAVAGATLPLLFIEVLGFHGTLKIGAALNLLIALAALALALRRPAAASPTLSDTPTMSASPTPLWRSRKLLLLLFATGFTSMGMEVVWIRQFTPYLGTMVYAFASILATYLASTFVGSRVYRLWSRQRDQIPMLVWPLLGLAAFLPLLAANPEIHFSKVMRLGIGIVPFSFLLGFVTPMLVDRWSEGDPDRAGRAYSINIVGCILGPLLSGFVLLPVISERWALFVLALPWLLMGLLPDWSFATLRATSVTAWQRTASYVVVLVALALLVTNRSFEDQYNQSYVLRDNTATSIAAGSGMKKNLLINGIGITGLSPAIKMMAHLPLSFLNHKPQNVLVICFGMGTTYRSMLSWGIPVTGVELVPSVPELFGYYHADGPALLHSSLSNLVIDDGRRYLERTNEKYDVIAIDPPPPVSAAGSSLLYSEEFYGIVKQHLKPGGILHQWLPGCDEVVRASASRSLRNAFPYVRVFPSVGAWGIHFIASMSPIPNRTAKDLLAQMPPHAVEDMMEWGPETDPERHIAAVLNRELSIDQYIAAAPEAPALKDDRPVNEYFLWRMRKHFMKWLAG
ncbi:MAG: fused MFS/spermidine synthase [Candidatus Korobacteraceae bacterium]